MIQAKHSDLLFELTQPEEEATLLALHDYFDWMFFAN